MIQKGKYINPSKFQKVCTCASEHTLKRVLSKTQHASSEKLGPHPGCVSDLFQHDGHDLSEPNQDV